MPWPMSHAAEGTWIYSVWTLYALYATQCDFIGDRLDATIGAILQHLPGDFSSFSIPILIRRWQRSSWRLGHRCWRFT